MKSVKVKFGPYEVDPERGTLKKYAVPVRLREQAIRVLIALVEKPGELVSRDELQRKLWTDGTFVDFDVGLNTAVSRLRQALNDPVSSSRIIETVPKRGYRFIAPIPKQHSLAVMPFVNQSPGTDGEYFSEGLTDELIRACWRIEGVRIAGRATVTRFQKEPYEPVRAAGELGVDSILQGSIHKSGDQLRIHVHLINGADGFEMWAERFDVELEDLSAIQDQVAQRIARVLQSRLKSPPSGVRTRNSEAYTSYLKGHFLIKRHNPFNSAKALQYFEESIRADPRFALAYHGAAIVRILETLLGVLPPRKGMAEAEELLEKGLAIQSDSAMLQMTTAMLRMFQWRWSESEEAYQRAIALEPSNPHPHMMFALHHIFSGHTDAAWQEAHTALDLDPVDSMINFRMVQVAFYSRQYASAIRMARTTIALAPEFQAPCAYLALALLADKQLDEASTTAQKARLLGHGLPFCEGQFGYIAGTLGNVAEARDVIAGLATRRSSGYGPAYPLALVSLGLSDLDSSIRWLETAIEEREPYMASVAVSPIFDPLRAHPRFDRLLSSMGFRAKPSIIGATALEGHS